MGYYFVIQDLAVLGVIPCLISQFLCVKGKHRCLFLKATEIIVPLGTATIAKMLKHQKRKYSTKESSCVTILLEGEIL